MPDAEIDARMLPPSQRHAEIFAKFHSLTAGESFVLVSDHYPRPLLFQFQAECRGAFEWNVLEAGPTRFRVEIRRRPGSGGWTVSEYLESDHQRLDDMLPGLDAIVDAAALAKAGARFREFACGLGQHIDAEERVLFPAFEQLTGMRGGPTTVMCAEHVEIRRLMAIASASVDAQDVAAFKSAVSRLVGTLATHNMKEEQILYPMTDRAIATAAGRDDLVRQMQAV